MKFVEAFRPRSEEFLQAVASGLSATPKSIAPKFFYDKRGSELFMQITELSEYYPTRTETQIFRDSIGQISDEIGADALFVEFGSGASEKIRIFLDHLKQPAAYVAIDISAEFLKASCQTLAADYPNIEVIAVHADYTDEFKLPDSVWQHAGRKVVFLPGSTIGNLEPAKAVALMKDVQQIIDPGGCFLVGVDLPKDKAVLEAAYNDDKKVTADFNRNLLNHINDKLNGNFDLDTFEHRAFFNAAESRIEMHLVSKINQTVTIYGSDYSFSPGESIHTENAYKYSLERFAQLADQAGLKRTNVWTDNQEYFSVQFLEPK